MPEGNLHGHMTGLGTLGGHLQGSGTTDYNELDNRPQINNHTLEGNQTSSDLGLQDEISFPGTAGVYLDGTGAFSTPAGTGGSYTPLTDKPQINGVELDGNLSLTDLDIQEEINFPGNAAVFLNGEGNFTAAGSSDYDPLTNKPQINGHTLSGNQTSSDLGLQDEINFPGNTGQYLNGAGVFTAPTVSYSNVTDKPSINGHTLEDNQTSSGLGLQDRINFGGDSAKYLSDDGTFTVPGYAATAGSAADADHATSADNADNANKAAAVAVGSYTDITDCYIERAIPEDSHIEYQKLIGATLAWNQLVDTGTTAVTIASGHKYIKYSGGTYTKGTSDGTAISVTSSDLFFDITQMFGSTIADSLTVEQFSVLFPETTYAYESGKLESVNVSAHKAYDSNAIEVSSITLDSSKEFRGLYKLIDGELRSDGDVYEADGTVTRKYGIVDLGTLNYTYDSSVPRFYTTDLASVIKGVASSDDLMSGITSKYEVVSIGHIYANHNNMTMGMSTGKAISFVNTFYSDAPSFKTSMNGVYLVYELATPTTESATPYTNPQLVDADGTEEFIDYGVDQGTRDVSVPAGVDSSFLLDDGSGSMIFPEVPGSGDYVLAAHDGILYWLES